MLKNIVSGRYARALFDLVYSPSGAEAASLKSLDLLKNISESIQAHPFLKNILFNPSFGIEEKKKVLWGLVDSRAGREVSPRSLTLLKNFFSLLIKKNRLVYLPEILAGIEELKARLSQTVSVTLTVPKNISNSERTAFTKKFENRLRQKINLTVEISPEILGGIIVQIGSRVFDGSLQMQLRHLRKDLMA